MKLTRHHIARGWRVSLAESKKQPYIPWAPDPDREYPARQAHRGGRGQKHRRKHDLEEEVDLMAASDSDGELEAKHQRRYNPRRSDKSPSRRRSPGYRHDRPPPRRRTAYRDERLDPRDHPSRHDRHAAAPLLPYPYSGVLATRVAMAHNPYAPLPWSPPSRPAPLPAVLRTSSEGPLEQEPAGRNEDIPDGVSQLCHSHLDGVPRLMDLHLGAYTPSSPPREWGLVPMPAPGTAQFVPPPYALHMCLNLPAGVHYYRACSGTDSWPRGTLSLVGAVHCVQVSRSHQIQFCRKGMPPVSLILPEHHHVVLPPSLHNRVSIAATRVTCTSLPVLAATYHPRHLRKWVRGLPRARKLHQHPPATHPSTGGAPPPDRPSSRPVIVTPNVQMSLRPRLRALDVLIREY